MRNARYALDVGPPIANVAAYFVHAALINMVAVAHATIETFLVEVPRWSCLFPNMLGMMLQIPACYLLARSEPDIIEAARIFKEHLQ